ncbi:MULTISPECIES: YqgE/AlgH family protein [Flavobacteriaceae]|uniref:YqgE/AlgH family protein n=1 Tax=Flavobacteriaceae TaxID=49546 RepID=UPI0010AE1B8C|nr:MULTISPECIES: YqgE/AlgH family protein [Flavobacteriaceae]NJB35436.1 YqgE/AlgH family protein [Croceivirga sp. JEA036]TKD66259.1 YqgE/AlgH family protein [Flavobacterium sp. ASW18X]
MTYTEPHKGRLLIAEPSLTGDVSFNRSVVLIAEHNEQGSVGFILNKPLDYDISELVPEISQSFKVYNGGPVEQDNLYFIHRVPQFIENSIEIADGIYWGGDFENTITLINDGTITAKDIRFFLGYSGWDSLQLKQELSSKSWVVTSNVYRSDIINKAALTFWKEKMMELGGDYLIWSNAPENPILN